MNEDLNVFGVRMFSSYRLLAGLLYQARSGTFYCGGAWIILAIIILNFCLATYMRIHAISKKDLTKDTYIRAVQYI